MPNNIQKFVFLGAVIAVALFSRIAYPMLYSVSSAPSGTDAGSASLSADAPLFVMHSSASSSDASDSEEGAGPLLSQSAAGAGSVQSPAPEAPLATVSDSFGAGTTPPFIEVSQVPPPAIAGEASLIADLSTGDVFLSANADNRWPLASVTKLMTASIVVDDLDLAQKVTVTADAVAVDPSQKLLNVGDTYTVADLLKILLLPSSNVAAETLADFYGRARFIDAMNARAASWGMASTHYDDPSGLSAGNESTPDDLLKLAQKIYTDYPQILEITRTPEVTLTELSTGRSVLVKSINDFAGRADFIGGKTGYTDEADGNLLSIFNYENRPVLVVVMGTSDDERFNNTLTLYDWFTANFK